jgi:phospholipid/cholesterol/gamma-HCH transport system substrate-binding protein
METRAHFVLVGAFVVFFVGCAAVAGLWLARVEFQEQIADYDIYFSGSVTGLVAGSPVRDNGIPVGHVTDVRLDPKDPTRVRVTVEIAGNTVMKTDSVASFEIQGLTGGAFINITGGSLEAPPLVRNPGERYPVIASVQSGLQRVVESAPEALARLIELTNRMNDILNEQNRQAITQTLENLRRVSAAVATHSSEIDSALTDGAAALRELRKTLESANAILATLNQLVSPTGDMSGAFRNVSETSRKIAEVAQRLDTLLAQNGPPINNLTHRGFDQIESLIAQAQQLVQQLGRISDTLERDPTRFFYGDRREGYQPK